MQKSDYICRKAVPDDNICKIAEYIYHTDPYIYPFICNSPKNTDWVSFISDCYHKENNIYSVHNISVVLYGSEIVGIMCVVPCGKKLTFTEEIAIPKNLLKNIKAAENGYFKPFISECLDYDGHNIINLCIDEKHRNKGTGSLMMAHCLREYGEKDIHLDVIASNLSAIRLYKKFGFVSTSEYEGFSGNKSSLPCLHMLRKPD